MSETPTNQKLEQEADDAIAAVRREIKQKTGKDDFRNWQRCKVMPQVHVSRSDPKKPTEHDWHIGAVSDGGIVIVFKGKDAKVYHRKQLKQEKGNEGVIIPEYVRPAPPAITAQVHGTAAALLPKHNGPRIPRESERPAIAPSNAPDTNFMTDKTIDQLMAARRNPEDNAALTSFRRLFRELPEETMRMRVISEASLRLADAIDQAMAVGKIASRPRSDDRPTETRRVLEIPTSNQPLKCEQYTITINNLHYWSNDCSAPGQYRLSIGPDRLHYNAEEGVAGAQIIFDDQVPRIGRQWNLIPEQFKDTFEQRSTKRLRASPDMQEKMLLDMADAQLAIEAWIEAARHQRKDEPIETVEPASFLSRLRNFFGRA